MAIEEQREGETRKISIVNSSVANNTTPMVSSSMMGNPGSIAHNNDGFSINAKYTEGVLLTRSTVPTTEELVELEKEVHRLIDRKRRTDLRIIDLETRIHAVEGSLLREVSPYGPFFNGLGGYLAVGGAVSGSSSSAGGGNASGRKGREIKDTDRLFSHTSASVSRALVVYPRLVRESALEPITIKGTVINVGGGVNSNVHANGTANQTNGTTGRKDRNRSSVNTPSNSRKRNRSDSSWNRSR